MDVQKKAAGKADTLYAKVGGRESVNAAVERFYGKVLEDAELNAFFAGTNLTWMKLRFSQYLAQALGGPADYRGPAMKAAHGRLSLERGHFKRAEKYLAAALAEVGVPPVLVKSVMQKVAGLEPEIVKEEQGIH
ncbi:MAG: group 1 truncated hemoglobin [Acidobacteriia bacterium]|nr:group 1 truncated hemoglobin [Terriglobia bacterium]